MCGVIEMTKKIFTIDDGTSFAEICEFAEGLGWKDPDLDADEEWTPEMCDATEEDAIRFILGKGYLIERYIDGCIED